MPKIRDIDRLDKLARKRGMRFKPVNCNMMQLTRKQIKDSYHIHPCSSYFGSDSRHNFQEWSVRTNISVLATLLLHIRSICMWADRTLCYSDESLNTFC